jgi:class 3 adenylate cyclase
MLGTKQILGVHKIIRSRELDCAAILIKHLFSADAPVVNSALLCFKKYHIAGLATHYLNLYKASNDGVRSKILDNVRIMAKYEYKEFLLNILPREASPLVKEKTILAMGSLSSKGELELLNDLRDRVGIGTSSDAICAKSIEALFLAGDLDFLSTICIKLISINEADWRAQKILGGFWGHPHKGSFLKFHKYLQKLGESGSTGRLWLRKALFGCYEKGSDSETILIDLKEEILELCGSSKQDEAQSVLDLLEAMDSIDDKGFAVTILTAFTRAPLHSPRQEQQKSEIMGKILASMRDDLHSKMTLALSMAMEQVISRSFEILDRKNRERLDREGRPGGEMRSQFLAFFESLGHAKLTRMVVAFLKTPLDISVRNTILSVLNKLRPTLPHHQKVRLVAVVKLLMEESNRTRAFLSVECGKIDFEEASERIFRRLRFLAPHCAPFIQERVWETLLQIHKISVDFEASESLRKDLLRPLLHSGREQAMEFVFEQLSKEDDAFQESLFSQMPPLVLYDLNFLKASFGKGIVSSRFLRNVTNCLSAVKEIKDSDWLRIMMQIESGALGQVGADVKGEIQRLICSSDPSAGLQFLTQKVKSVGYQLTDALLKCIGLVSAGYKENKSKPREIRYLKDLLFGCLKIESNERYVPELCYFLIEQGEDYGEVQLINSLDSEHPAVLCRAIDCCKKARIGKRWKSIFYHLDSDDFLVQNAVVSYFERDYSEFNKAQLKRVLDGYLIGEKETDDQEAMDEGQLEKIFGDLESSTLENTATFGRDQKMKELTIFFIDIAGYTKRSSTTDISDVMSMLEDFGKIIEPIGEEFDGRLIKKIGDCFMYTFDNPLAAILGSLKVQVELQKYNEFRVESDKLRTRIGLNTGRVYLKEGDVYGDPVNTASRVESKAPLDGTLIHESTFKGLEKLLNHKKMDLLEVKGISHPIQTYHILSAKPGVVEMYFKNRKMDPAESAKQVG